MDIKNILEKLPDNLFYELHSLVLDDSKRRVVEKCKTLPMPTNEELNKDSMVDAIQTYKERVGCGLYEAKCQIETYRGH